MPLVDHQLPEILKYDNCAYSEPAAKQISNKSLIVLLKEEYLSIKMNLIFLLLLNLNTLNGLEQTFFR